LRQLPAWQQQSMNAIGQASSIFSPSVFRKWLIYVTQIFGSVARRWPWRIVNPKGRDGVSIH
jgi:hypothetical protein